MILYPDHPAMKPRTTRSVHFLVVLLLLVTAIQGSYCQIKNPVKWKFKAASVNGFTAEIKCMAALESGWHVYSLQEGLSPTRVVIEPSAEYTVLGAATEGSDGIDTYDSVMEMRMKWFERKAVFTQRIKINAPEVTVKGSITFMVCTKEKCLPAETIEFEIIVRAKPIPKGNAPKQTGPSNQSQSKVNKDQISDTTQVRPAVSPNESNNAQAENSLVKETPAETRSTLSVVEVFIAGFLGGLAAFLMPCIFPMVPFTVGVFSKRQNQSRKKSIQTAILFGLSVILIYTILGLLITVIFGSHTLNELATNGVFNFIFFLLLVLFAASFLGAFEITLPSSWVNSIDSRADRTGNFSIFFVAASLALVSFSCTGPIIGTLLVEAAASGSYLNPVIGMIGFSTALALPFMLFALFPGWLKAMPKSGGWLNSVKVTLGFLELALALKFLSNVDLAYHWNWFDREVFLVLWIIIFGLLGFYLLGKIRFVHDSVLESLSVVRTFLAIGVLAFAIYLIPGLWGAPLKAVAAFLPPQHTQDFDLSDHVTLSLSKGERSRSIEGSSPQGEGQPVLTAASGGEGHKYSNIFHAPLGLNAFFDYEEGMAYAKQVGKPVLIDFTGHACVNCRKMEAVVWSEPEVLTIIRDEYVLIQLYVDDKTGLPEAEQVVSGYSGKKLVTLGNKWSDFQAATFNTNSQPYYVLLNNEGQQLVKPQGANYNVQEFENFLLTALRAFRAQGFPLKN